MLSLIICGTLTCAKEERQKKELRQNKEGTQNKEEGQKKEERLNKDIRGIRENIFFMGQRL
jgi:hypothetical protein